MGKTLCDSIEENCGLASAINVPNASEIVRDMSLIQQDRGDAGAGVVSSNHQNLHIYKNVGRVDEVFPENYNFKKRLPGKVAIGHNRYPTKGSSRRLCDTQPILFRETKYGQFAISHNGQLVDKNNIKKQLIDTGAIFQSTSDSETLAHLIVQSKEKTLEGAIASEINKIPAAYSLLIMTKSKVIALRDQYGVKPLSIAQLGGGYLIASETSAFRIFDKSEFIKEVKPVEMVIFDKKSVRSGEGFKSIQFAEPKEHWCVFEGIYFSSPRSKYNNFMHEDFRQRCGMKVYHENKEFFENLNDLGYDKCIIPILDSGKQGAVGFQKASKFDYKEYFMRRHNAPKSKGRSYTASKHQDREYIAHMKLDLRAEKIKDKVIITLDDSEVRGVTSKENNKRMRDAGAKMIINVLLSPKITSPCYLGMDHQKHKELIAYKCETEDKIAKESGADKTIYLSLEGLNKVVDETYKCGICSGCFGGKYPPI